MALWFCALFFVVFTVSELLRLTGVPFIGFEGVIEQRQREAFTNLDFLVEQKKKRLELWIDEIYETVDFTTSNKLIVENTIALCSAIQLSAGSLTISDKQLDFIKNQTVYGEIIQYLNLIKKSYKSFNTIKIADAKSDLILASTKRDPGEMLAMHHPSGLRF